MQRDAAIMSCTFFETAEESTMQDFISGYCRVDKGHGEIMANQERKCTGNQEISAFS